MSIQSLPPRIHTHLGRFTLALLIGAVLALSGLLPSVALARTQSQVTAFAPDPNYVLDKAGVSVVRLVVTSTDGSNVNGGDVTCTGLGVLVGSVPGSSKGTFQNWVLTDANLLNSDITTCELPNSASATIQILASNAYTRSNLAFSTIGKIACTVGENTGLTTCQDENPAVNEAYIAVPNAYGLFSFQTTAEQPYLSLAHSSTGATTPLGLTNGLHQAFPVGKVAPDLTQPQSYLEPTLLSSSSGNLSSPSPTTGGSSPTATSELSNGLEPGIPRVDASGNLASMSLSNGSILDLPAITKALPVQLLQAASPNALKTLWDTGMNAYAQGTPAACQQARTNFQKIAQITPANANFQAATAFASLAQACAQSKASGPAQQLSANGSSFSLMILLIVGLVVLLLVLVLVTLLVGRMHKRQRELAQFAAEQTEALRLAEVEHQRQKSTHTREIPCPNCHQPVHVSDAMCRNCRYPLSPSASGLNVRLGSGPLPAASLPVSYGATQAPPPPRGPSVSDMPTIQFPPSFAGNQAASSGEKTLKRQKAPHAQDTVYDLPHLSPSVRNLNLAVGTLSDPGLKRKYKPNEDSLFAIQGVRTHDSQPQRFGLFVVADGMGGHANGQDASRTAIQTIIGYMLPRITGNEAIDDEAFTRLLSDGVQNANLAVHNRNLEVHADMGTTMTAALVVGATAYVANVGDSRTYRYTKDQGLSKVSMDHSVVASLVEAGIIQPDDIYTHPKRNQIYRSLGEKPVVEVDTFKVDIRPGDKLLLCSDGLWDMVRDPLIQQVMSKPANDPNKTGQELIKAALQGGGEDNVTVIVVQFSELKTSTGMTGVQLHAIPETVTLPDLPPM